MDKRGEEKPDKKRGFLRVLLVFLILAIIGLAVGIVVVLINKNNGLKFDPNNLSPDNIEEIDDDFISVYESEGESAAVEVYQQYLDKMNDNADKIFLLKERIFYLNVVCGEYCKDQILSDVWEINSLGGESEESLNLLCAYEGLYGDQEKADEYCIKANSYFIGVGEGEEE